MKCYHGLVAAVPPLPGGGGGGRGCVAHLQPVERCCTVIAARASPDLRSCTIMTQLICHSLWRAERPVADELPCQHRQAEALMRLSASGTPAMQRAYGYVSIQPVNHCPSARMYLIINPCESSSFNSDLLDSSTSEMDIQLSEVGQPCEDNYTNAVFSP